MPLLLLVEEVSASDHKIELLPDVAIEGKDTFHVRLTDTKLTAQSIGPVNEEWYFDKATYLPVRLAYPQQGLMSMRRSADVTIDYGGFTVDQQSGLMVSTSFRRSFEGGLSTTCTVSKFATNQNPDQKQFTRSSGGAQ